jgi:hypothetical protein
VAKTATNDALIATRMVGFDVEPVTILVLQ